MVTYTAYYDASGTQDDPDPLLVCGCVARTARWRRFTEEWVAALAKCGLDHFHRRAAQYRALSPEQRMSLNQRLLTVIQRNVSKSFYTVLYTADFDAVNEMYPLEESFGGPYALAAAYCGVQVGEWMKRKKPNATLRDVYEHGDQGQGKFRLLARHLGDFLQDVEFLKKRDPVSGAWVHQFAAPDLLAGEHRRAWIDNVVRRREPRPSLRWFAEIVRRLPDQGKVLNREHILRMVENPQSPILPRNSDRLTPSF